MHLQTTPIYYVKYGNEKSQDKSLRELINKEGMAEVTAVEEGRVRKDCEFYKIMNFLKGIEMFEEI